MENIHNKTQALVERNGDFFLDGKKKKKWELIWWVKDHVVDWRGKDNKKGPEHIVPIPL